MNTGPNTPNAGKRLLQSITVRRIAATEHNPDRYRATANGGSSVTISDEEIGASIGHDTLPDERHRFAAERLAELNGWNPCELVGGHAKAGTVWTIYDDKTRPTHARNSRGEWVEITRPKRARLVTADGACELWQSTTGRGEKFVAVYGLQYSHGLNYGEAAAEHGANLMHQAACNGTLQNQ